MCLELDVQTDKSITLQEYKDYLKENVNFADRNSVINSAAKLKQLSNNKTFLAEFITDQIINPTFFEDNDRYTAQVIILESNLYYMLRANVWVPLKEELDQMRFTEENHIYAYDAIHDHNFDLLTVGYHGSGYTTNIYEYDSQEIEGYPEEHVDIKFVKSIQLTEGKMLFFRKSLDIHLQNQPKEFSISIHLIPRNVENAFIPQYSFNPEEMKISRVISYVERKCLIDIASYPTSLFLWGYTPQKSIVGYTWVMKIPFACCLTFIRKQSVFKQKCLA